MIDAGTISKLPEWLSWPVSEYKDTAISLEATEAHTVLLYVPE